MGQLCKENYKSSTILLLQCQACMKINHLTHKQLNHFLIVIRGNLNKRKNKN